MAFKEVDSRMNLPHVEEEVLSFWDKEKIFEKTLDKTKDKPLYSFYDGPPFATGYPHYGHLLASVMKDVVPRYWTMRGRYVERVWGWDCHGLPIENIAEKELGYTHKKDIENLGVDKFNSICRSKVLGYVAEWKRVIKRFGRFVDMENAYKTMDLPYMESIWWTFKQLWDKGLIYEGYRSMHICPRCETTLSQSEVAEGYKVVKDLSVTAKFEIPSEPGTFFLAWTTTPWTLIANAALAVGSKIIYVKIQAENPDSGESEKYIMAKDRLESVMRDREYEVLEEIAGEALVGMEYEPVFDFYIKQGVENHENGWKVYTAPFVTTEDGTGIVHIAPAFGEDDMRLGQKQNLPFLQHIGMDGMIKSGFGRLSDLNVKPRDDVQKTDIEVIKDLAPRNKLFFKEKYEHSYPHCWRCDTPLLNYATSSWFVAVTKIKESALKHAEEINWSPDHIKNGRFGKWLEGARDWSISRQRFWASVIPIWKCECGEMVVTGSIDELRAKSIQKITKLIFVRHGESEKNVLGVLSNTHDKWPLTEKGKEDAEHVKNKINDKVDLIIASPILRARETADIINAKMNVPIEYDNLIAEQDYGLWNDKPMDHLQKFDKDYQEYQKNKHDVETRFNYKFGKMGESRQDIIKRIEKFLLETVKKYPGKTILIVSHGGINAAIHRLLHGSSTAEYLMREEIDHRKVDEFYLDWSGKPFDLHKDVVDQITLECPKCGLEVRRIPDVLDTWFDSGSMPFAQLHYPFDNREKFDKIAPADYIAEYQDQCRAWFYYLHIISSAVTGKIAFKNAVVSGTILAEDGRKMSKRLKNYPDPNEMIDKYGADALRFYLTTSPVMQAENLNFKESELAELYRGIFRMLWNSYSFFVLYANIDKWSAQEKPGVSSNILDRWIISLLGQLTNEVNDGMESYNLVKASRAFVPFVDNLSNWYIRRSRKRFWKTENDDDKVNAYQTLYTVLVQLSKLMAPFTPFIAEEIYKNLTGSISVHLEDFPKEGQGAVDSELNNEMSETRKVVELGLSSRAGAGIKVRQPLQSLTYHGKQLNRELEAIVAEEVNVKMVQYGAGDPNTIDLDLRMTDELKSEGLAREIIRTTQELRKNAGFKVEDRIHVHYKTEDNLLDKVMVEMADLIRREVLAYDVISSDQPLEKSGEYSIESGKIWLSIGR